MCLKTLFIGVECWVEGVDELFVGEWCWSRGDEVLLSSWVVAVPGWKKAARDWKSFDSLERSEVLQSAMVGGKGIPAWARACAIVSVRTGFSSSASSVSSSTKPQARASFAVNHPPCFIKSRRAFASFLHLVAYISAMLASSLSRSFFCFSTLAMSEARSSEFMLPHSKKSIEHLCTRYMALASMVMTFAPSEAMVAAEAFMPTKCA